MDEEDLDAKIAEQIGELDQLIAQMKEEQRLVVAQIAELQAMRQRLLRVQSGLRPVHFSN